MAPRQPSRGTALITGAARRIGEAMAISLAGQGYTVAIHYNRSQAAAARLAARIRKAGGRCALFAADLNNEIDLARLIPRVQKQCPGLKVLINNASIFKPSRLASGQIPALTENIDVHLKAPYALTSRFAKLCKDGQVINILDTHITRNASAHAVYLLSKKALRDLTLMTALEFAPRMRINAIAPGLILPPAGKTAAYLKQRASKIPLKRSGRPQYITAALDFLLANDFITGQILYVDGGEHLV